MTLSSNETAWATMIVALVISMGWAAFMTWMTIKAQNPEKIPEIQEAIKNIFFRIFVWMSNLFACGILIREYLSSAPISRRDVFTIVWSTSLIVLFLILRIAKALLEQSKVNLKHMELHQKIANNEGQIIKVIEELKKRTHNQEDTPA